MKLLAIDPGTTESAWVLWDGVGISGHGKYPNDAMLAYLDTFARFSEGTHCCIEMVASFGMPVGAEVFETVYWIGRFAERFGVQKVTRLTRNEIKNHLCHSSRAKDANIRQAIIDRLGPVGTKKAPGPCYGLSGDVWSAVAVALTWWDTHHKTHRESGSLFEAQI